MTALARPTSVVIIGGGLIGLCCAFELRNRGMAVVVVDESNNGGGAAVGNAGLMCSAMVEPLPAPGALRTATRSMFDPAGALRMRPNEVLSLAPWLLRFMRHANARSHSHGRAVLGHLNLKTPAALASLAGSGVDVHFGPSLVVAMEHQRDAERLRRHYEMMAEFGAAIPATVLDGPGVRALVPALNDRISAGFVLENDRLLDPRRFVDSLVETLRHQGVELLTQCSVQSMERSPAGLATAAVLEDGRRLHADHFVVAAGSGSVEVLRLLDVRLPVISGVGYNVMLASNARLTRPVLLEDAHVVASPFSDGIRFGGTMELTRDRRRFDERRVDAILRAAGRFLDLELADRHTQWSGPRPLIHDGLPVIGPLRACLNVHVAVGHGMYGLTLAPATATVLADLLLDGSIPLELTPCLPARLSL